MASLAGQSIASSYEQLLHVDRDGGGNGTTHVAVKDGDNGTTFPITLATDAIMITSTNRLEFGDDGTYIHQSANGVLDLVSDTTLELNGGAGSMKIDANSRISLSNNDGGGSENTVFGKNAMNSAATDMTSNVIIGHSAGSSINHADADDNVIIGNSAGTGGSAGLNNCTIIGRGAVQSTAGNALTGITAIGSRALTSLVSGQRNTALGFQALEDMTQGSDNIAIGYLALNGMTTDANANQNIGIGNYVMDVASNSASTAQNVCIGHGSGSLLTGDDNTCVGNASGDTISSGEKNTIIGSGSDTSAGSTANATALGYGVTTQGNNTVTLGNNDVTKVYMAQDGDAEMFANGTINTSDERLKEDISDSDLGLLFINKLRAVSYKFKNDKRPEKLKYGIIAQEVQEVLKTSGNEDFAGITEKGEYLGADYVQFIAPLIKAVQELSAKVEELESKIN
jgi:hypothetical protein